MDRPIRFLNLEDVLRLHQFSIETQGGDASLRDRGLLESALAMPRQQFGGAYLHPDIPAMAAAYAFHICKNHPFVDGNKRAATGAMIAFLLDNGWSFDATADQAEPVILDLASGKLDKSGFTAWLTKCCHAKPSLELREFFSEFTLEASRGLAQSVAASGREVEVRATMLEAGRAMPILDQLLSLIEERRAANPADPETVKLEHMCVVFTLIYRIAEDMGYEW